MKEFLFIDFHLKVAYVVLQCRIAPVHVNTHLDLMHFLYPKLYSWRGALFHSINILALSFLYEMELICTGISETYLCKFEIQWPAVLRMRNQHSKQHFLSYKYCCKQSCSVKLCNEIPLLSPSSISACI